jgi:hypothetical protein
MPTVDGCLGVGHITVNINKFSTFSWIDTGKISADKSAENCASSKVFV